MYLHFRFPQAVRESRAWPESCDPRQLTLQQRRFFHFVSGSLCCQWQDDTALYRGRIWEYRFHINTGAQQCTVSSTRELLSLVFVTRGRARLQVGGEDIALEQGRYYLLHVDGHTPAGLQFDDVFCALQVDADLSLQEQLWAALPYNGRLQQLRDRGLIHKVPLWASGRYDKKLTSFFKMHFLTGADFATYFTQHILLLLPVYCQRLNAGPVKKVEDCCMRAEIYDYIRAHLNVPDLLKSLPETFYMSKRRLERLFTEEPMTLSAFIQQERMELAMRKLKEGRCLVKEVAEACGMVCVNSFSRSFRRYWHKRPTDIR